MKGSEAVNAGFNGAFLSESLVLDFVDSNSIDQRNDQSMKDITHESEASNIAANNGVNRQSIQSR